METRKTVFICNLLIILLCIISIASYFFMPFWKVSVKYTLTAESLQELLPSAKEEGGTEGEGDEPIDADDIYSNLDFNEIVGKDGITLNLNISLETSDILDSLSTEPTVLVENILDDNVENLVDQLDETLSGIVKKVVTSVVRTAFTEGIKEEIKKSLGEGTTDEQAKAELNAAGLDDAYLDEKANQLVDSIYQDGATSESAAESTIQIVEESIQKMKESGNPDYADLELSEEAREELKVDLIEQFKNFENDDGSIDPEAFTSDFLLNMLKGNSEESSEGTPEASATYATPLAVSPLADESINEDDAKAELRQALTDKLMGLLGGAEEYIALIVQILSYVIIAMFVIWGFPILKILLKMGRTNNAIKLGAPIWLGSLPYIVLCLVPKIALSAATNSLSIGALSGLTVTFSSCAMVSFFIGIALAIFVLFFYRRQRKILKRGGRKSRKAKAVEED